MQKKNVVTKQSCHSRGMLSGISRVLSRYACKEKTLFMNNPYVGDPRLRPSGMTPLFKTRGFTLIELLVVVLIIGILAAVALPQYKKAVIKSRVATILPVLSSIIQAQEMYYLANGQYTDNAELMDLQPPANCAKVENDTGSGTWKCGNDFVLDIDAGAVYANYCPKYNNSYTECQPKRDFVIVFGAAHSSRSYGGAPNTKRCGQRNSSDLGNDICKTLGEFVINDGSGRLYELY